MKLHEFLILFLIIFLGTFAALITWTLIVKQEIQSATSGNTTLGLLNSLFSNKG